MDQPTTIHFVRHGEVHNLQSVYYGRLPGFHLSAEGSYQAKRAAAYLEKYEITAIYSRPLERAAETASIIGERLGIAPETSDLLLEAFSPYDGQAASVLAELNWDIYTDTQLPYEQPNDLLARAKAFTWQMRRKYPGRRVIAVTHGDLIAFMILWARQLPITPHEKQALYKSLLTYASISSFTYKTELESEIPTFEHFGP